MPADTITPAVTTPEDSDLLMRVAAGDQGAPLVALYQRYSSRLFGLGLRLLGERGMAEEMVQETFVRLWRSAPRFDPSRGSVSTFTFTIARRVAVDLLRRRASRPLPTQETLSEQADIPEGEAYDRLLVGLEVRDALETLSPKHRDVIRLMVDEDLGQADIAERLQIPVGTVKTRTFYGLRALRTELEGRGVVA